MLTQLYCLISPTLFQTNNLRRNKQRIIHFFTCSFELYFIFLRYEMFAKILDNPDLPKKQIKQVLKNVLTQNLKQNVHEVRLQFNHNYPQLKPILMNHPKYALRLALSLYSWQLVVETIENKRQNPAIDLLRSLVVDQPINNGQYLLTDLSKSFQDHWRVLAILQIVAGQIAEHMPVKEYGWFLATFVKLSASVIMNYIKIKNQQTHSNNDRIQSDLQLFNNCQKWVTSAYVRMLSKLQEPKGQEEKLTVLAAFSQICGALLENERSGQLEVSRLLQIQRSALQYIMKSYSLSQVGQLFVNQLNEGNFASRLIKIQIPDTYTNESLFAKQGICWLIQQIVKQSNPFYSEENQLKWLIVALSQCLESPLPIKDQLLTEVKDRIGRKINCGSFGSEYPSGLFLFFVSLYSKEDLELFKSHLGVGVDAGVDIRRWKKLLQIELGTQNVDKTSFVVGQICQSSKNKQILRLIKSIRFDFANEKLGQQITTLLTKAISCHPEGKSVVTWLIEKQQKAQRNHEFCIQMQAKINQ